ncbi:MAG: phage tail protein [Lachnospiraceae bacterium]|nr:phage tail protein [Lachnospiraceae bacterium]
MYTVLIGDIHGNDMPLYYPNDKEFIIYATNLNLQVGLCGEFTFRVPPDNPRYSALEQFKIITVQEDGKEIWRGFIKEINESFDMSIEVYCLEDLAWMQTEYLSPVKGTYDRSAKLQSIISGYNALDGVSGTVKTFEAGYVIDSGYGILEVNYETTMLEGLRGLAGDNQYVRVRRVYDNNNTLHRYIDFVTLNQYGITSGQRIEFGSNLINFVKELNTSWMLNVIYPYGAEIEGSEVYEDCPQRLTGTPLSDSTSIEKYGRIAKNVLFETSNSSTLQTLAENYLAQNKDPRLTLELTAVDLSQAGYDIDRLALGDKVRVIAAPFNIDQYVYITDLSIDIQDPGKNSITLSSVVPQPSSLSDQINAITRDLKNQIPNKVSILDSAKANALALLNGTDGGHINIIFNANEQPEQVWITDSVDPTQATKKWVWNENGLGYMYKENGTWKTNVAMTMNGSVVADMIATGLLTDALGNNFWDLDTGEFRLSASTEIGDGETTLDDLAQKSSAIADVDVEYAKNQSNTTAPSTGWSTSSPQWESGYYIWQRTKTTNGNSQVSYSDPVCIQGAKGQDGSSGHDGIGISSVTITYGKSSSPSTQPSSWSSNMPTVGEGEYLWTKTYTVYTDVSVPATTTYTYAKQGEQGQAGQNGQNGQDGTSVTVSSIQYQQGDSATTAPSGTWSSNPIVVAQGKYLWTKTTYSDNSVAYTVAYQAVNGTNGTNGTNGKDGKDGKDGTNGTNGQDGRGVASTTISYGTSNSADAQPSSWSSTAPTTLTKGTWLWVKTYITYTDNQNPTTSYTKSYIGTDGNDGTSVYVVSATKVGKTTTVVFSDGTTMTIVDGTDGSNGSNGLNGYVHTAWATTVQGMDGASSTTGFSTTVSSGKKYLGTYTDNTAADSSTWSDYSWSLIKGADGANGQDGDDGVGVSAIEEQYILTNSSTTTPSENDPNWSTAQPAWSSGKYIWTRSHVTWTNNTVTNTAPVLAKAINGANEAVNTLDTSLDQQGVFDRLTNDGQTQGIYLDNGLLYINGTYMQAGIIKSNNYAESSANSTFSTAGTEFDLSNGLIKGKNFRLSNSDTRFGIMEIDTSSPNDPYIRIPSDIVIGELNRVDYKTKFARCCYFNPYTEGWEDDGTIEYQYSSDPSDYPWTCRMYLQRRSASSSWTTLETIYLNHDGAAVKKVGNEWVWDEDHEYDEFNTKIDHTYGQNAGEKYRIHAYFRYDSSWNPDGGNMYLDLLVFDTERISKFTSDEIMGLFHGKFRGSAILTDLEMGGWSFDEYNNRFECSDGRYDTFIKPESFGVSDETTEQSAEMSYSGITLLASMSNKEGYYTADKVTLLNNTGSGDEIDIEYDDVRRKVSGTYQGVTWGSSDRRIKENIKPLDPKLSANLIDMTEPQSFKYKNIDGKHYGMIAQDVRDQLDKLGETDAKLERSMGISEELSGMDDQRTIDYQEYIPHLINYVKDLRSEITGLKEEINKLKGEEDG